MNFTRENARNVLGAAEKKLVSVFGEKVTGAYAAAFQSVDQKTVVGACNLPYYAPVVVAMMNTADIACYLEDFSEKSSLFIFGDTIRHLTEDGEVQLPENIAASLAAIYEEVCEAFPEYNVFVGGSSSFDMSPKPYNKYYALDLYCKENGLSHDEVAYVGDDYGTGGNDECVYKADFNYIKIDDYRDFPSVIKELL
jgi:hydroxymethylpyrimidine pyrophosphatase-like HAD family hydrolase